MRHVLIIAFRTLFVSFFRLPGLEHFARRAAFFQPLVKRFVAGEDLDAAIEMCRKLRERGLWITLDYLGESSNSFEEATEASQMFHKMLEHICTLQGMDSTGNGDIEHMNISVKPSQFGMALSLENAKLIFKTVVDHASQDKTFIRVDMEASPLTGQTLALVDLAREEHPLSTGPVIQAYLHRSDADILDQIRKGARIRLVKGAYLEKPSIAVQHKDEVDERYRSLATLLLRDGVHPAFATHDENIIEFIKREADALSLAKTSYEFQMLYGVRSDLQSKLVSEGYRVRVYVPFGSQWYPYFVRRLAERPANLMFLIKSLVKH